MNMVRLIYVSRMTEECDTEALEAILDVSRRNNEKADITGFLCYDPNFFLQCLEGPRTEVNRLYSHIICDDRHNHVTLVEYSDINDRIFANWSMGFARAVHLDPKILKEYAFGGTLNPTSMSAVEILGLLKDIAATLEEEGTA